MKLLKLVADWLVFSCTFSSTGIAGDGKLTEAGELWELDIVGLDLGL